MVEEITAGALAALPWLERPRNKPINIAYSSRGEPRSPQPPVARKSLRELEAQAAAAAPAARVAVPVAEKAAGGAESESRAGAAAAARPRRAKRLPEWTVLALAHPFAKVCLADFALRWLAERPAGGASTARALHRRTRGAARSADVWLWMRGSS